MFSDRIKAARSEMCPHIKEISQAFCSLYTRPSTISPQTKEKETSNIFILIPSKIKGLAKEKESASGETKIKRILNYGLTEILTTAPLTTAETLPTVMATWQVQEE